MRGLFAALLLTFFGLVCAPAYGADLDENSKAIVAQLTLDRAANIAMLQRRADERETTLLTQLAERDRNLRAARAAAGGARATREQVQRDLNAVTLERQKLIDQIAGRDRQFAAEIAEYRRQIASIASSPDPRKRAALERYAAGDRQGAMDALIDIQNAETHAIAAGWRDLAVRALDNYQRKELSRDDTIAIVSRAANLLDDAPDLWSALSKLLAEAGRNAEAADATARAARSRTSLQPASPTL